MQVDIRPDKTKPGFYKVLPKGSIDSDNHGDFRAKLEPILNKSTKGVVLDLTDVDYISSAGLGVLFSLRKFLLENGGSLLFCNLKPQIQRLFELIKALPKECIFKNTEEADQYFYEIMNREIRKDTQKKFL